MSHRCFSKSSSATKHAHSERQAAINRYDAWQKMRAKALQNCPNGKLPASFRDIPHPPPPPPSSVEDADIMELSMELNAASLDSDVPGDLDDSGIERVPMADPGLDVSLAFKFVNRVVLIDKQRPLPEIGGGEHSPVGQGPHVRRKSVLPGMSPSRHGSRFHVTDTLISRNSRSDRDSRSTKSQKFGRVRSCKAVSSACSCSCSWCPGALYVRWLWTLSEVSPFHINHAFLFLYCHSIYSFQLEIVVRWWLSYGHCDCICTQLEYTHRNVKCCGLKAKVMEHERKWRKAVEHSGQYGGLNRKGACWIGSVT